MKLFNLLKKLVLLTSVVCLGIAGVIWAHQWATGLGVRGYAGAAFELGIVGLAFTAVARCCWAIGKETWLSVTSRQPLHGRRNGPQRDQPTARLREITLRLERAERLGDIRQETILRRATARTLLDLIKGQGG